LCNRNKKILEKLKLIIYRYAEQMRIEIVVDCYYYGEDILMSGIEYNIIFIDYFLYGKNGLEIAKELRTAGCQSAIVFTSNSTHFVLESFSVSPQAFLLSPVKEDKLLCVLNDYFKKKGADYPLWIKSGLDTVCLNTSEIVYLEANNKHCFVNLNTECIQCNRTMARVYKEMPKNHFLKINRAFIVNLDYVNKYNNDAVYLKNGAQLRISRHYLKEFKQEYRSYVNPRQP